TTNRPTQPAQEVQQHLLDTLNELGAQQGITFTLGKEKKADDGAATVAAVESATVSEQAAYMMQESDNMLAEALGRNAAVAAGKEGSEQAAKD
ncbi:D-alanyl-D-alanine carboxypeptidase, partial [Streptococcus danieliae]|nr:D-alanyl-D-alanine carboxypeptidase [Streptococcus danieliae]